MARLKKFEIRLGSLIQLAVIASMLMTVAVITVMAYGELSRTILRGFDGKLRTISTATAAFIKGEDHDRILASRQIVALTIDSADGEFYGIDTSFRDPKDRRSTLVRVHPDTGEAVAVAELAVAPVSLTGSSKPGVAYALIISEKGEAKLAEVELRTGGVQEREKWIPLPKGTRAIEFDPAEEILYAGGETYLSRVDPETGMFHSIGQGGGWQIGEMTRMPAGRFLAFDPALQQFLAIDSRDGKVLGNQFSAYRESYESILRPTVALAPDVDRRNAPQDRTVVSSNRHPIPKSFLKQRTMDANRILAATLKRLAAVNPVAMRFARQVVLGGWRKCDHYLHDRLNIPLVDAPPRILAATDRLIQIDPETLEWRDRWSWIDPETLEIRTTVSPSGFHSENDKLYLKYVAPMRRIKERLDLKYLYTQTLSNSDKAVFNGRERVAMDKASLGRIIYGIDANTDEDHSAIGEADTKVYQEDVLRHFREVQTDAEVHVTKILPHERWGELKSGYAPIRYDDPTRLPVAAMTGADVGLETIRRKLKIALARVILTGLGALALASLVSIYVSRKLTRPIERMKDVALRIAAGHYGEKVQGSGVRELNEVAETFNLMSTALEKSVSGLEDTNRVWEQDQRLYELIRHLTLRDTDLAAHGGWAELLHGGPSHHSPSGWTNRDHYVAGWLTPSSGTRSKDLAFRARTSVLLYELIQTSGGRWDSFRASVSELFENRLDVLFLIDFKTGTVDFQACNQAVLWSLTPGSVSVVEPLRNERRRIEPGTQYVVCVDPGMADDLTRWSRSRDGEFLARVQVELGRKADEKGARPTGIALSRKIRNEREENT